MEITCPRCQVRHLIDAPASSRARPQRALKFRCSHCGYTFAVDPQPQTPSNEPPRVSTTTHADPEPAAPAGEPIHMMQSNGQMWPVPDMATLQRWILEHRVTRADLVSNHGLRWQRVGERPDLALFFTAADRMEEARPAPEAAPPLLRRSELPDDEDIYVEASDPRGVPPPPMPLHTGPRDNFVTIIPPEPDAPTVDEHTMVRGGFGPDPDTQEQTIQSSQRDTDLAPLVQDEPERTANLRPGRRPEFVAIPPLDSDLAPHERARDNLERTDSIRVSERTESLARAVAPPPPLQLPPPDPIFGEHTLSPLPPRGEIPQDSFDPPPEFEGGSKTWMYLVGAAVVAVTLFVGYQVITGEPAPSAEGPEAGLEVHAARADEAKAATEPGAAKVPAPPEVAPEVTPVAKAPEVEPAPVAKAPEVKPAPVAKAPEVKPAPVAKAPEAKAPKPAAAEGGGSPKKLVASGWKAIEAGDMQKAHGLFARALQGNATLPDALYGRAYASEKLGDPVSAHSDYCSALAASPAVDLQRELQGGLRRIGKTCP